MPNNPTTFNLTEEAFLLNSLHEVVKIWGRGSGHANFNLQIENGSAELQLSFKLGCPDDPHIVLPEHVPSNQHFDPPKHEYAPSHHYDQDQEEQPSQHCRHRRRKGPARKEKDRIRARNHQQARIIQPAALESLNSDQNKAASADIILPFDGKLLLIKENDSNQATDPVATTPTFSTAPPPSTLLFKAINQTSSDYIDVPSKEAIISFNRRACFFRCTLCYVL